MQQELIEMLEKIIPYVEAWNKEDQDVIDKAEALVDKAKNNNAPAVPQGEQINKAFGKLKAAQMCHPNAVQCLIEEAIDALATKIETSATHKCNTCGFLGVEDPIKGCLNCGFDDMSRIESAAPAPVPAQYKDSTPHLSVGESSFEYWFESYNPANKGDKQRSRDAYAAGMGDPLVAPAPAQGEPFGHFRAEPFGWTECAEDDEGAIALYERPQEAELRKELDSANDFIKSLADLIQRYETMLGYRTTNAPEGAYALAEAKGESSVNTELDLACADSTCQHDFALDPKSSIRICLKCGTPERLAKKTAAPAQEVGLIARQFDLICQAIDKADTATMEGDYMLDSDDCIAVVRVMQALFDIAALRAKGGK